MHGLAIAEQLAKAPTRWSLAAVVDGSVASYMRFRSVLPDVRVPFYRDVRDALKLELDAVDIVTPAPSHVPVARSVVKSGFSGALLIEKPLSHSLAEGEQFHRMLEELAWKGTAGVDFHRRCSKLYAGIHHRIRSGEHGNLIGLEFSRACKLSMNGSHFVDLANWFVGSRPASVSAELDEHSPLDHRGTFFFDPPGKVEVTYENGVKFLLDARGTAPASARGLTVRLEKAELWVNADESALQIRTATGTQTVASDRKNNALNWVESTLHSLLDATSPFRACTVAQALDSLAVIVAAHLSHRQDGRALSLPLPEPDRQTALRVA
jgi:predicted dehydrogenase